MAVRWAAVIDQGADPMPVTTHTFCQICEQACGLRVTTDGGRILAIEPDRDNRHSWRDFCVKAATADQVVTHPQRLRAPMKRVGDRYVAASYEEAITDIAARLTRLRDAHGPAAIASYAGNPNGMNFGGSLFLSLLMEALASHNRYWVGSLDQNALHAVAELMYGSPWVLLQPDVDHAECVLLIGSNPAVSTLCWIGRVPNGWKRLQAARAKGAQLIVVDPRRTESARKADVHLAVRPDQDWALLLAMLRIVFERGWQHADDCAAASGIDTVRALALGTSLEDLARRCDVPLADIEAVTETFARADRGMALARTGSAQGINGSLTEWLSHVLNLVCGRTDRRGGRLYNPGLVDPLVAGDEIFRPNRATSRVRGLPTVAGAHSTAELAEEITTPGDGQVRALLMVAGNPVVSGPDGRALDAALAELDTLVVIDLVQRESHRHADWLIPASHWLERSEFHPLLAGMSTESFAQVGRAALPPPEGVRHEWEFLRDLMIAMKLPIPGLPGGRALAAASRVLPRLTGNPYHAFGPAWIARLLVARSGRVRWSALERAEHGLHYGEPPLDTLRSRLTTPDRRIDAAPAPLVALLERRLAEPPPQPDPAYPLQMLSRRRKHTMNSWLGEVTGPRVPAASGDLVEIAPADAAALGFAEDDAVEVCSRTGAVAARVRISPDLRPGTVVFEQGWGSRVFSPADGGAEVHGVNRNLLVANDELDPVSCVPRLNGTPVRLTRRADDR